MMLNLRDLKYAMRLLRKKPRFTILTTLVMAVGIGLSIYLFSFLNTMIFKALPFEDGDSIIRISGSKNGVKSGDMISIHDYQEIRTTTKYLSEFSAYRSSNVNVSGRDGARRYSATEAEPNIFQITRTKPVLGREFSLFESQAGAESVVVLGYDIWQNQFAGSLDVIEQSIRINGVTHRIIGVMPEGYVFPVRADMWLPLHGDAKQFNRGAGGAVYGVAHVDNGASLGDINRELSLIMQRIEQRYPQTNSGVSAYADTFQMSIVGDGIAVVYSMHVVAILILVLTSINVGNLLLSRAIERGKETAIRVALGAPRSRLIGQMMWENIIICAMAGLVGLIAVAIGLDITATETAYFSIDKPPFWWQFGIDAYAITLFFVFLLVTSLFTGLLPAWKNSGANFNAILRDGTRGALSKKSGKLNKILVVIGIFVSVTVLISASVIMVASFMASRADYGPDTDNILTASVVLPESIYGSPDEQAQFVNTLQSLLENSSTIGQVMVSTALPGSYADTPTIAIEGREYTAEGASAYPRANYVSVGTGSLAKLEIELKQGRYFDTSDDGLDKRTAIVTESFVSRRFPNESALGKRIRIVTSDDAQFEWFTIVGVVEHTIQGMPIEDVGRYPTIFRPFSQVPNSRLMVAVEMKSDKDTVTRELRNVIKSMDPNLPAFNIDTYTESIKRNIAPLTFASTIFLLFGLAAMVLSTVGIYGVMSNTINQRTQEIGVKRALGANDKRIITEFIKAGAVQLMFGALPGLTIGTLMGFAMSQVFGINQAALIIIALTILLVIGTVVILAAFIPTKRALIMEPIDALRYE